MTATVRAYRDRVFSRFVAGGALAGDAAFQLSRLTRVAVLNLQGQVVGTRAARWGELSSAERVGLCLVTLSIGVQAYQSGSVLVGAMGMAGAGAALGSVAPPGIGTAGATVGLVLGGLLGLLGQFGAKERGSGGGRRLERAARLAGRQ